MNAELEAIKDKWAEKTTAKYEGLAALAEAKAIEDPNKPHITGDAAALRNVHALRGIDGDEGALDKEHLAMCDAYVKAHPEEFKELESLDTTVVLDPEDGHELSPLDKCVKALEAFRAAGFEESQWRTEVWLRHHFEPQSIGGEVAVRFRTVGLGG